MLLDRAAAAVRQEDERERQEDVRHPRAVDAGGPLQHPDGRRARQDALDPRVPGAGLQAAAGELPGQVSADALQQGGRLLGEAYNMIS